MSVLVGRSAPDFTVPAVLGNGEIIDSFHYAAAVKGRYSVVFFYPLDFTFVCPSELVALDNEIEAFRSRDVEVMSVSIDSQFTHHAWRQKPVSEGGIGPVRYTMVADIKREIAEAYGVLHPEAGVALRGAFIIDKAGIVRAQMVNDLPLGRHIPEILRLIDALQFTESHGEVCPANWQKGKAGMKADAQGVADYLREHAETM